MRLPGSQWPLNKLKTEGSLRSYGQAFTPKDFGLNPKTLRCSGYAAPPISLHSLPLPYTFPGPSPHFPIALDACRSWGELYKGLDPKQQERAAAAEDYLLSRAPYAGS